MRVLLILYRINIAEARDVYLREGKFYLARPEIKTDFIRLVPRLIMVLYTSNTSMYKYAIEL